jgi:outer membrane protein
MKKFIFCIFACLILSGFAFAEVKIGFVNPQYVLQNTIKGREVMEKINAVGQQKQKRLDEIKKELERLEKDLTNPALNQETKDKKAVEMQTKRTEAQRFVEDSQREMEIMRQRELGPVQNELLAVIDKIAKEEGYTMIFDTTTSGFAYVDMNNANNISVKFAKAYDAQAAAKAAPAQPAPKKEPAPKK